MKQNEPHYRCPECDAFLMNDSDVWYDPVTYRVPDFPQCDCGWAGHIQDAKYIGPKRYYIKGDM